ncbi:Protein unc-93 homolog A,UNC93-like protein [Mytilus coruscus]|uniref:Protein unc-93 homolog A,UNC93-like protein n=1 Tax=Mytilus coruscus TaxID=42192 RepID=A0A6J8CXP2_MYTCO|nr:Protein unc-93 homolog A,UNC93-like protein [Mytilus coruscus]
MNIEMSSEENKEKNKDDIPFTKFQILKNLVAISCGFLFIFIPFQSITNLQSTLNKEDGLGTGGLAIIYGALVISCMFLPSFVISHLGCKWTIAASMVCYLLYMAANFHAVWSLIVPASVIIGLGSAPLWSAKCSYLTRMAIRYAHLTNSSAHHVMSRFFGFFFMVYQTCEIWGNIISSQVLSDEVEDNFTLTTYELRKCGANYDPGIQMNNTNLDRPNNSKVHILCWIYMASVTFGFLIIVLFLQNIPGNNEDKQQEGKLLPSLMVETFKHLWKSPYQKLLVILTIYSGVEQAFIAGDFTKSYISCAIGIGNVGFVMISYGIVNAICSLSFGKLMMYVGQIPLFAFAFVVHGGTQTALLPQQEPVYIIYIFAGLWGIGDAVIQAQINALYGFLFKDNLEPAFSNYRLFEAIGFLIAFAWSNFLKTYVKLYICLGLLTVGIGMYGIVEMLERTNKKKGME